MRGPSLRRVGAILLTTMLVASAVGAVVLTSAAHSAPMVGQSSTIRTRPSTPDPKPTGVSDPIPTFYLNFTEVGLVPGDLWEIFVYVLADPSENGTIPSETDSVDFSGVPDGSYGFEVDAPDGYTAFPAGGTITVDGSSVTTDISFLLEPTDYLVVDSILNSYGGSSIDLSFQVAGAEPPYTYSGGINGFGYAENGTELFCYDQITGPSASLECPFVPYVFYWTVYVNACIPDTDCLATLSASNAGRYLGETYYSNAYGPSSSWATITQSSEQPDFSLDINASAMMDGPDVTGTLCPCLLEVYTDEPPPQSYFLSVQNVTDVELSLPPGIYEYAFGAANGDPDISGITGGDLGSQAGASSILSGTFTVGPSVGPYNVTFEEAGLPEETHWAITLDGVTHDSSTDQIEFHDVPRGLYLASLTSSDASVLPYDEYVPIDGEDEVDGVITFDLTFFNITFEQNLTSELPVDHAWSVTASGKAQTAATADDNVTFYALNGTYPYQVRPVAGYRAIPEYGNVTISDDDNVTEVTFLALYKVTFHETGLLGGTNWSVTLGGMRKNSTTPTITFSETNGTVPYTVNPVEGYTAAPTSGSLTVLGAAVSQTIVFSPNEPAYLLEFQPSVLSPTPDTIGIFHGFLLESFSLQDPAQGPLEIQAVLNYSTDAAALLPLSSVGTLHLLAFTASEGSPDLMFEFATAHSEIQATRDGDSVNLVWTWSGVLTVSDVVTVAPVPTSYPTNLLSMPSDNGDSEIGVGVNVYIGSLVSSWTSSASWLNATFGWDGANQAIVSAVLVHTVFGWLNVRTFVQDPDPSHTIGWSTVTEITHVTVVGMTESASSGELPTFTIDCQFSSIVTIS